MRTSEIRTRWLDYFEKQGHEVCPSVSLVSPEPSILFTIAGMVPFIPYIMGVEPAPWPRAASVQKCIRTNDIDNVGKTTRHGTFFQMNGNFSFGDYFKEGAINFAWDLLTGSRDEGKYGLDGDRFWVTIWDQDEEALDVLTKQIGMDPKHIVRLPRVENFWDTGQPGPAGPCAEWHYDRGPAYGPEAVGGTVDPGGDRYLEVWNLVFDQYMRGEGAGKDYPLLGELDKKAIDTGAGLERLAFVMQDKPNMYEIDEVFPVIDAAMQMSGKRYGLGAAGPEAGAAYDDDVRMRVVADHVRSSLMLIGDGVRPGNDGRGYVLRRLIRRAVRSMRLLGVDEATMPTLLTASKDAMKASYPELETNWKTISEVAYAEEDAFRRTLSAGTTILDAAVASAKETKGAPVISGESAFSLHDTYGFPIDLTLEMAAEQGVSVDEEGFRTLMAEQKERARADARSKKTGHTDVRVYREIEKEMGGGSTFLGYTQESSQARVQAILVDGKPVPVAEAPAAIDIILDRTPFYAEMGGQLADHGTIRLPGGDTVIDVTDVQAPIRGLTVHRGHLRQGGIALGDSVIAEIDSERRLAIARAHTATHMVYAGLRNVVSEQADQAGSENSPSRLRFDFRHSSALTDSQVSDIEALVNEKLAEDMPVTTEVMSIDAARDAGAIALFGEKYGSEVRVVTIGDGFDRELCGGTHVPTTGHIGRVTVLGEGSVASGVRRIEALVGTGAYEFQAKEHALVSQLSQLVGGRADELPERIESLLAKLRESEKKLDKMRAEQAKRRGDDLVAAAVRVGAVDLVAAAVDGIPTKELRGLVQDLLARLGHERSAVVALAGTEGGKVALVVATNERARDLTLDAGALLRAGLAHVDGRGGGKADIAQGGGTKPEGIQDALRAIRSEIESL